MSFGTNTITNNDDGKATNTDNYYSIFSADKGPATTNHKTNTIDNSTATHNSKGNNDSSNRHSDKSSTYMPRC